MTGFGLTWLVTSIIMMMLAANYSNNLLLFIALIMFSIQANGSWLAWLNIRKLTLKTLQLEPIYALQTNSIKVQLEKAQGKYLSGVTVSLTDEVFAGSKARHVSLGSDKLVNTEVTLKPLARGRFAMNNIQLSYHDSLGLWHWKKNCTSEAMLWVYPTPQGKLALPKPKAKQGTYLKREQGDFSHVRSYQRGDSLNHIAWKQMARTGDVMTKEFDGGEGLRQTILSYQEMKSGDTEQRLSQLCRWILDSHQKQLKYSLELPNQTIDAAQGEAHKEVCLQALAQFALTVPSSSLND